MTKEISNENCLFHNWNHIDPFYGLIVVDDIIAKAEQSGEPADCTAYISRAMFLAMTGKGKKEGRWGDEKIGQPIL